MTATTTFSTRDGLAYGLLGLPLAFVALPLYVVLPHHYASTFGLPLATLGAVLLGARLLDAFTDPLIGRWTDRRFAQSPRAVLALGGMAAVLLALGFALLFFPPTREPTALALWAAALLVPTYAAFSVLSVGHQAWGARLGGDAAQRSRIVAWREGAGLVGVITASVVPLVWGIPAMVLVFVLALAGGWWAWTQATPPPPQAAQPEVPLWLPLQRPTFRRLLLVFVLNGIASAVPATLVLFFVQDRLQAPAGTEPLFLLAYFVCAALSIPLWLRLVRAIGLARSWLTGMLLAVVTFMGAFVLGAGDVLAFAVVCALSGLALGADLAVPGAMLAGTVADNGDQGAAEGTYFGWWNFATKLNLALAAGLSLPLLALWGYVPGTRDAAALQVLAVTYCLLPCALKLIAACALYMGVIRPKHQESP